MPRVCPPSASDNGNVLEVVDLHQRFGDVTALDGVSLAVAAGKIVGRVGRNYAGALVRGSARLSWRAALRLGTAEPSAS